MEQQLAKYAAFSMLYDCGPDTSGGLMISGQILLYCLQWVADVFFAPQAKQTHTTTATYASRYGK